jgi:large subunit ribosomal protein L28
MVGNNVSHSNIKTKTRSLPNLQKHRFWLANEKKFITLRLSAHGLRIINKRGIDRVVAELRAAGDL